MQIDFHHAVTYVCARMAGFEAGDAAVIAHAAQYVDDSTSNQTIHFDNNALFRRSASAHSMVDLSNASEAANMAAWLPFHFLPSGNEVGQQGEFIPKIICRPYPDSPVAKEMVENLLAYGKNRPYSLHWLGVTMHVLADTWAHQDFAGVLHAVNNVNKAEPVEGEEEHESLIASLWDKLSGKLMDKALPPLGHAQAGTLPDMPFLKWQYRNDWRVKNQWLDQDKLTPKGKVVRDNTPNFLQAANTLCWAMQRYRGVEATGLPEAVKAAMARCFKEFTDEDGAKRHAEWSAAIEQGRLDDQRGVTLRGERIAYPLGEDDDSWKKVALGTSEDRLSYPYRDGFLTSHWKLFHDAVQAHRFHLLHDILPKYGICAG